MNLGVRLPCRRTVWTQAVRQTILLAFLAALVACARPLSPPPLLFQEGPLKDLQVLPQDPAHYAARAGGDAPLLPWSRQQEYAQAWLNAFLSPWQRSEAALSHTEIYWAAEGYRRRETWGENLRKRQPEQLKQLVIEARPESYPSRARRAIAIRNSALRALPTQRPLFLDPQTAGEGYPFDYLQNSALWVGTPLLVTHATASNEWLLVETGYAAGWVPAQDLAYVDDAFCKSWQTAAFVAVVQDNTIFVDGQGNYLLTAHVGAVFPAAPEPGDAERTTVLVPVPDPDHSALLRVAYVESARIAPFPLPFTAANVARVANGGLAGQAYGWGGLYENRDCSAMLRDLFAPFGLWLPRNSAAQARTGRTIPLDTVPPEAREQTILEQGRPFRTLLTMKGHVMLYVGQEQGRAVAFHNLWGLRTRDSLGRDGRYLVGRAVFTSLEPGQEILDVVRTGQTLRTRLRGMAILGEDPH